MTSLPQKLAALGPGVLMATAAIGGSHLVAATQAGALFGWQLLWLIILVNLLKYPFFRFGVQYTLSTGKDVISGYRSQGPAYFYSFLVLNIIAAIVNTAGVLLLCAVLAQTLFGAMLGLTELCLIILAACLAVLLAGRYHALDFVAKWIMALLVVCTLAALAVAVSKTGVTPMAMSPEFEAPSIMTLSALSFIVVMMGWMPAPIEISAINSLWLQAKQKETQVDEAAGLFDFNLGYILTAVLAVVFFSLEVLIQYGGSAQIEMAGVAFSQQLISMYTQTIGPWSHWLIALIAFLCLLGTTITVLDGYARTLKTSFALVLAPKQQPSLNLCLCLQALAGLGVVLFFKSNLKEMLTFAMTLAFLTTPVFAWLNYRLIKKQDQALPLWLQLLSIAGLAYLSCFSLAFIVLQFY